MPQFSKRTTFTLRRASPFHAFSGPLNDCDSPLFLENFLLPWEASACTCNLPYTNDTLHSSLFYVNYSSGKQQEKKVQWEIQSDGIRMDKFKDFFFFKVLCCIKVPENKRTMYAKKFDEKIQSIWYYIIHRFYLGFIDACLRLKGRYYRTR